MALQWTPFAIPLVIGLVFVAGIGITAWQRRHTPGADYLIWLCLFMGIYIAGYAFEISSTTLAGVRFWLKAQYLGVPNTMPTLLLLILAYTGHDRFLTRRNHILLYIFPALTILVAWTNDSHELIWRDISFDRSAGFTGTTFSGGPWYWMHFTYIYTLVAAILFVLIRTFRQTSGIYHYQIGIILVAMSAPLIAHLVFLAGLTPAHLDITPYAYSITSLGIAVGMFYFKMFDVVPVAHEAVVHSLRDPVLVIDSARRIVEVNPAAQRLIGKQRSTLLGSPINAALPAALAPVAAFAVGDADQAEIELRLPEHRCFDARSQTAHRWGGRIAGYVIVLRDITERRKAEQERTQLIDELDAFAHTVAHDLNNPLSAVSGFSALVLESWRDHVPPEVVEAMTIIEHNSTKAAAIIRELLLLSGVRQMGAITMAPLDMAAIVQEAQLQLVTVTGESNAVIHVPPPDAWPAAAGHTPWIEEVWANYISNAIKYGGTPPQVTLGGESLPDGNARFWVRDNGQGIPAAQQDKLFMPFTRLHQVRAQGHGLGLSIVRRIIEKHGGTVGVESAPGQGSLFYFTLPPPNM